MKEIRNKGYSAADHENKKVASRTASIVNARRFVKSNGQ